MYDGSILASIAGSFHKPEMWFDFQNMMQVFALLIAIPFHSAEKENLSFNAHYWTLSIMQIFRLFRWFINCFLIVFNGERLDSQPEHLYLQNTCRKACRIFWWRWKTDKTIIACCIRCIQLLSLCMLALNNGC